MKNLLLRSVFLLGLLLSGVLSSGNLRAQPT